MTHRRRPIGVYHPGTVRLVEIRLLEGPNLYRLAPTVKLEVALGDDVAWDGARDAAGGIATRLWSDVPAAARPASVARLAAWVAKLQEDDGARGADTRSSDAGAGSLAVHRGTDPGHWVVSFPWHEAERSRAVADTAWSLAEAGLDPATASSGDPRVIAARSHVAAASPGGGPAMIGDADRTVPIISISGTNGKSTVTMLITHILVQAGRHVGSTTSEGIYVDGRLVQPGDWTGPGGAAAILERGDVDVAVLETARGGILLRGVGYASNDASVITNVSSDHLDLQGIHTLAELAAAKATICRITRADGWVILNAEDPHVVAIAGLVKARVAYFAVDPDRAPALADHVARGRPAYVLRRGALLEVDGGEAREICRVDEVPLALGGLARHNVANALAAAGGARAMGASLADIRAGLREFRPTAELSPGRLNIFRLGAHVVIVDFAHNEAGIEALLVVAGGLAAGGAARTWPVTAIIGTAGDRPDDALRGIGRIAAAHSDRIAIKETLPYLRGRSREHVVAELRAGIEAAGRDVAAVPVYETEVEALRAELAIAAGADTRGRPDQPHVVVLLCHAERDAVFALLAQLGARPVDTAADLRALIPRLSARSSR